MSETLYIEKACAEVINTYLFDKVWNEPVSEYRSNIIPAKLTVRSVVGSFATTEGYIPLPSDREPYFIWTVGADEMRISLNIPDRTWVSTSDCILAYRTKLDFYTTDGKMFSKCAVYIRYNADRRILFIAAKKDMLYKCTSVENINNNRVCLTTYFDSDINNNLKLVSFKVGTIDSSDSDYLLQVSELLRDADTEQVLIFKNGVEVSQSGYPDLTYGNYYDVLVDENIEFAFDVDLVTDHEAPAYLSVRDEMWKQLIHIPKELNPDNRLYTGDTCDFYIRRKESETPYGLYMHRMAKAAVTQVTHNDFGIPLMVIDAYRDYMAEQEISLHVVVRRHDKDNVLIQEAGYIYLLYSDVHSDADIINILCGKGPENIPWWRADKLESGMYVGMMFDTPNRMLLDRELMDGYIDTLGYHHVINLLCHRSVDTIVDESFNSSMVLNKPLLYAEFEVYPLVYLNGRHISFDKIVYTNTEDNRIFISIDKNIVIRPGDILSTVFYLSDSNVCRIFTLDTDTLEINVPYSDPLVYEAKAVGEDETILGVNDAYEKGYVLISDTDNIYSCIPLDDGGTKLVFNSSYIGAVFVIQNKYATYRISKDITETVNTGKSLAITLETQDNTNDQYAPILKHESTSVFYNGKYLVEGIDYYINRITNKKGYICATELVIQSMDHYDESRNVIDILVNQDTVRDNSNGFMIDDKLYDDSPVNLQYSNTTVIHVNGMLCRDSTNKGNYTLLPKDKYPEGSIWEIQTAVPKVISDFIAKYSDKNDDNRLEVMNEYFSKKEEKEPDVLVIDSKHRIYSVFLNELINQVLADSIAVAVDPDINRLDQAIGPYLTFKEKDITYKDLDQRFIDYYPQYTNTDIPTDIKPVIDYLISVYLPENKYPSLHSVAEECNTYQQED